MRVMLMFWCSCLFGLEKIKNDAVEEFGFCAREGVSATLHPAAQGSWNEPHILLRKVTWSQDVVVRTQNKRRNGYALEFVAPIKVQDGVEPAGLDFGVSELTSHFCLGRSEFGVMRVYPIGRVQ